MPNAYNLEYVKKPSFSTIKGLAFPMRNDGIGGFATANENLGCLRDGVIQLILTARGARVMRPDYGTDIRKAVFEVLDDTLLETLRGQIIQTIETYEPRVIVKRLDVTPKEELSQLHIELLISTKDDILNEQQIEILV